jgi:aminoglycoside 2'-N-acetyltransferase I
MEVDLQSTPALDDAAFEELHNLRVRVHGPPELQQQQPSASQRLTWAGVKDTVCVVRVRQAGLLVSSLYVARRTVLVDGREALAGGVCDVQTDARFRRRGFASAAMQAAAAFMLHDLRVELGILFSARMAVRLYLGLGWQIFDGPVWCQQPGGTINFVESQPDSPPMLLPGLEARLPQHYIDMCGLPW